MKKSPLLSLVLAISIALLGASTNLSQAQELESYFYYLIPPSSNIGVNDEVVVNESANAGLMRFQREEEELLSVAKTVPGVKIFAKTFRVDLKNEAKIAIGERLELQAGSIHVSKLPNSSSSSLMRVRDLEISFKTAEFLAFVSGDQQETIIKVIDGEITVKNPESQQKATLLAQEATSVDEEGKLLSPYPFEFDPSSAWWESDNFTYKYQELPISHAGNDQRVLGNIPVSLDGSKSSFKTGDIFEWQLKQGPRDGAGRDVKEVAFDSTDIVRPLFTPVVDGEYRFSLQITNENGDKSNADEVVVYVGKRYLRPIAIFPDVPAEHPNNLAITYLYKKNVMKGSEDPESGKLLFRPDDTINRVEILKTVFENKKQTIPTQKQLEELDEFKEVREKMFLDVKTEHWFAPYVYLAKNLGIVKGNDGLYRPADKVLLVEALKIIVETNQISLDSFQIQERAPYPDTEAGVWFNPYLFFVKKYNLVDTDKNGHINPAQEVSRAQFAEIIYRMESINLLEKRGFLSGKLVLEKSDKGIADAEVLIYSVLREKGNDPATGNSFDEKGELFYKTRTDVQGNFSVSLPIHTKFFVEAITNESVTTKNVIIEVEEDKTTEIKLEIASDPSS